MSAPPNTGSNGAAGVSVNATGVSVAISVAVGNASVGVLSIVDVAVGGRDEGVFVGASAASGSLFPF